LGKDVKAHAGETMMRSEAADHIEPEQRIANVENQISELIIKITLLWQFQQQSVLNQTEVAGKRKTTNFVSKVKMIASKSQPFGRQPDRYVTGTYKPVGAQFTMTDFDEYRRDDDIWYSPHFYTHPNGYKMYLRIDANGNASGRGTHLSVFVCLMQGEFDDQLKWPFQGNITIKLANQEEDRDHVIQTFYSRDAGERCERVMTKERINNGWGIGRFLSHAELQPKYLKNNCIILCIRKMDLY
jgi:hypothetical protein